MRNRVNKRGNLTDKQQHLFCTNTIQYKNNNNMNAGVKTNILNDITRDELNTSVGSNTDIQTGKGREGKGKDFK